MSRDSLNESLYDWPDLGWDEQQGHDPRPSLLLGNGFSQNIWPGFKYDSLFSKASQNSPFKLLTDIDQALFTIFGTENFEMILNVLAASKAVSVALNQDDNCELLQDHENRIRKALIQAVHSVHIFPVSKFPEENRTGIANELAKYMSIYYTNYDLLIYWCMMMHIKECHENHFFDFFWDNPFNSNNVGIINKENRSGVYFLHGGLHLYRNILGRTYKQVSMGIGLLESFGDNHDTGAVPLFISEGTHRYKLQSIYQSDYLSFVFSCFEKDSNPLVILGHSLGGSDKHIANAINAHMDRPVAISVRKNRNIPQKKAAIRYALPNVKNLYFFDAATHPLLHESLRIQEAPQ